MTTATRILLTGGTGFLGSALVHHWVAQGHSLCVLSRPGSDTTRLDDIMPSLSLARVASDTDIVAAVRDYRPEVVVHTACNYGRGGESTRQLVDANVGLGLSLIDALHDMSADRVHFLNTATVLDADTNLYALSKTQFSAWGEALATAAPDRLCFADLRLQQMYGPADAQSKFTTHIIESCCANVARLALTAGEQMRDFIHINDVVQAYDAVLNARQSLAAYDLIDIGSGKAVRMRDFAELVKELSWASTEFDFGAVPYRPNEAMFCQADTARLRSMGWSPLYPDLRSGLRQMLGSNTRSDTESQRENTA